PAVRFPAPRAPPVLELDDLAGGFGHERLYGVLVGQVVAAADGVEGVEIGAVLIGQGRPGAALGRHRVAPHRVNLGDQGDGEVVGGLGGGDGRSQPGGPTPHDDDVVRNRLQ